MIRFDDLTKRQHRALFILDLNISHPHAFRRRLAQMKRRELLNPQIDPKKRDMRDDVTMRNK